MSKHLYRLISTPVLNRTLVACLCLPLLIYLLTWASVRPNDSVSLTQPLQAALFHVAAAERLNERMRADLLSGVLAFTSDDKRGQALSHKNLLKHGKLAQSRLDTINASLADTLYGGIAIEARDVLTQSTREAAELIDPSNEIRQRIEIDRQAQAWDASSRALATLATKLEQLLRAQQPAASGSIIDQRLAVSLLMVLLMVGAACLWATKRRHAAMVKKSRLQLNEALIRLQKMPGDGDRPASFCVDAARQAITEFQRCASSTAIAAKTMHELGHHARHVARDGSDRLEELAGNIVRLDSNAGKVGRALTEIEQIAFRTNVLALNAQVESSRAGEQGRGFSLLSDEVRKLALRGNEIASKMRGHLAETSARVDSGSEIAGSVAQTMRELNDTVTVLGTRLDDVHRSTHDQEAKVNNVAAAVSGLNDIVRQQASWRTEREALIHLLDEAGKGLEEHHLYGTEAPVTHWKASFASATPAQATAPSGAVASAGTRQASRERKGHLFENTVQGSDGLDTQPFESVDKFGNQQFGR